MSDQTYNGWSNYETWNVNLHLDQDSGTQDYWSERAIKCYIEAAPSASFTQVEQAALDLMDELRSDHAEREPEFSGTFGDLLAAALSQVNWYEIAKTMIDDKVNNDICTECYMRPCTDDFRLCVECERDKINPEVDEIDSMEGDA